ncbi:sigma-70 family RNA polymerase sigma factor [[Clostridium] aminophilum]|uniref:sigma-70 family RNA polymerase sigma factor n=1 Tax=[Clostridium] aminophilum TaxID=1526 RepID=UPI003F980142
MNIEEMTNEELFKAYHETGDQAIRQALTLRYVYIVRTVAYRTRDMYSGSMQAEDIINEGVIEIMKAIDRYDPDKDNKFETFISRRIRGMVIDMIRRSDWMPRNFHKERRSIEDAREEMMRDLGRVPSDEELAERLNMDVKRIQLIQRVQNCTNVLSLDMTFYEDDESVFQVPTKDRDTMPEDSFFHGETVSELTAAIESLKDKEKMVVSLYYVEELNMNQIAEVMEISQPRVSQLHSSAIKKLKNYMQKHA